jgi:membrane glycosyltransferase
MNRILGPITRKLGTAVGGFLGTLGLTADEASILMSAAPILAGLIFDTGLSLIAKRKGWQ